MFVADMILSLCHLIQTLHFMPAVSIAGLEIIVLAIIIKNKKVNKVKSE